MKKIAAILVSGLFFSASVFAQAQLTEEQVKSIAHQVKNKCGTDGIMNNTCVQDQVKLELQQAAQSCNGNANCLANYGLTADGQKLTQEVVSILTNSQQAAGLLTAGQAGLSALTTGQLVALSTLALLGAAAVSNSNSGSSGTSGTSGTTGTR